jgi:hypothetical protein
MNGISLHRYIYIDVHMGVLERETKEKELKLKEGDYVTLTGSFIKRYFVIKKIEKLYNFDRQVMYHMIHIEEVDDDTREYIEDLI